MAAVFPADWRLSLVGDAEERGLLSRSDLNKPCPPQIVVGIPSLGQGKRVRFSS